MQSLIKRSVHVSFDAHISTIVCIIQDALEIHRSLVTDRGHQCADLLAPDRAVYYRMTRQTGHSAALRRILAMSDNETLGFVPMALFHTSRECDMFRKACRESDLDNNVLVNETDWIGRNRAGEPTDLDNNTEVLIFSDTLHDETRMRAARAFVNDFKMKAPKLKLVVYLG